jgi:hypothetical protein
LRAVCGDNEAAKRLGPAVRTGERAASGDDRAASGGDNEAAKRLGPAVRTGERAASGDDRAAAGGSRAGTVRAWSE